MHRPSYIFTLTLAALCIATGLQAISDPSHGGTSATYGQMFGGMGLFQDEDFFVTNPLNIKDQRAVDYDVGAWGGVAFGYMWAPNFALELELSYQGNGIEHVGAERGGDVGMLCWFTNIYYRNPCYECYVPYVGVGVGGGHWDADWSGHDFEDTSWGIQGILGLGYVLCEDLEVFSEYRYVSIGDPVDRDDDYGMTAKVDAHRLGVGIRMILRR